MVFMYFRAAQVLHYRAVEITQFLVPLFLAGGELVVILSFFLAIRLSSTEPFITMVMLSIGVAGLVFIERALDFAAKFTESSRQFSRIPFLRKGCHFRKRDKVFLASISPLVIRVANTFTITKATFPTILQDIILVNLMHLLITF